jgi:gliding motility-associated-like protein
MRLALSALLILALNLQSHATHILGGEMTYTYLGNDNYQVTLTLYRDCGPANTQGTALDAMAAIGVFNSSGVLVQTVHFELPGETSVPVVTDNPCLTAPPSICTKQGIYSGMIHLPSGTGGYTLSYQRCCRSPSLINLNNNPSTQGMTCTVFVPDPNITGPNSSPTFTNDPPMVLCLDQTTILDQLATDPDGDSLVYALCAPLQGGDNLVNVMPDPPAAPPYMPVFWAPGYSETNQLNSVPPMTFGSQDGVLTLHPSSIGNFAVSLSVSEYRNGVLLSQVIRDFRFLVVACAQAITASIQDQQTTCNGLQVHPVNQSTGSTLYHWDFGVPGSAADTSNAANPTFTYPAPGTYTISLVAQPGWPCGDTAYSTWSVHDPVQVQFTAPPILCPSQLPVPVSAFGNFNASANVQWDFGSGVSPDPNTASTTVGFSTLGSHAVSVTATEMGCTGSFTDSIRVFPLPVASFTADTNGCVPFQPVFANNSTAWTALSYFWQLGDGSQSTDSLPEHLYTAAGSYTVSLTVSTDSGCVSSRTLTLPGLIKVWPQPVAGVTAIPSVTTVLAPEVTITDHSSNTEHWDFLVEGQHYDTTTFTHAFSDAGWYTVLLTATSGMGCVDTASARIFIGDHLFFAPTAFTPNGDGNNEVWKPSVIGARQYQLDVFDRWGHVVFSTTDPSKGWDGKNGLPGIYAYKAWLTEYGPLEKEYNGSFVLIK